MSRLSRFPGWSKSTDDIDQDRNSLGARGSDEVTAHGERDRAAEHEPRTYSPQPHRAELLSTLQQSGIAGLMKGQWQLAVFAERRLRVGQGQLGTLGLKSRQFGDP